MAQIITKPQTSIKQKVEAPEGYIAVPVLSWHKEDTLYYQLSPYYLRTDGKERQINPGNVLFENFWQGSKVYKYVYQTKQYCHPSRIGDDRFLWWQYPTERHFKHDNVLPAYFKWRSTLWECDKPIRYPNGKEHKGEVLFSLLNDQRLTYIEARKEIYGKEYMRLIRNLTIYQKLLKQLKKNKKLCIFEIDVPKKSGKDTIFECTIDKIDQLIDDDTKPCGHGLFLAKALLEDSQ